MNDPFCYLNGTILPFSQAQVSVGDIGLTRGFGVYDGIAAIKGKIFRFEDHWQRFSNSAAGLGLTVPTDLRTAQSAIEELIQKNGHTERANIRLLLTGGQTLAGIEFDPKNPTFIILVEPFTPLPEELYTLGGKLITHEYQRFMPEHKTTHYITAVMLQNKRKESKAIEVLYVSQGKVLECATSNFFMVKDKTVITPKANILKGITRKVVLELASTDFRTEERDILTSELASADELFITSSFKDIVPIIDIDGTPLGGGTPGLMTKELVARFDTYLRPQKASS